jgi:septal ring factor EnvC (AmiA/AmiB activator)
VTTDQPHAEPAPAPVDPALQQRITRVIEECRVLTPEALTTTVLAELRPELERAAHAGRLEIALRANQTAALEATERAEAAEAALARIRNLATTTHATTAPGRSDYDIGRHTRRPGRGSSPHDLPHPRDRRLRTTPHTDTTED